MSPLNNTSPFFFGRSFELLHLYWSSGLGLGLKFTPHIFNEIRVRALCRPFSNGHLSLLEVGFHQKWSKRALSCRKKVLEVSLRFPSRSQCCSTSLHRNDLCCGSIKKKKRVIFSLVLLKTFTFQLALLNLILIFRSMRAVCKCQFTHICV